MVSCPKNFDKKIMVLTKENYLVDNIFEPQLVKCTVQPDVKSKDLNVHDKKVRLRIWDTAGSERFRAINRSFFRNALGVIVVYDVTGNIFYQKP